MVYCGYKYTYQVALSLVDHFMRSFRNEESVIPCFGRFQLLTDPYNHQNEPQIITGVQNPHTSPTSSVSTPFRDTPTLSSNSKGGNRLLGMGCELCKLIKMAQKPQARRPKTLKPYKLVQTLDPHRKQHRIPKTPPNLGGAWKISVNSLESRYPKICKHLL